MGTDLQEVIDSFVIKLPFINFQGQESKIIQFMKTAIAKCYRHTYDNLEFVYVEELEEGNFLNVISQSSIELISMYMVKEYLVPTLSILSKRRQYLGTQAFNKIPSYKEQYDMMRQSLEYWSEEIEKFLMEFPDYSDER